MAHPTLLCDMSDVVLHDICCLLDLLELVQLFKVGHSLLTLKLTSPRVIRHYSDFGVNGISVCQHHLFVPKLRGLKSLSISYLPSSVDQVQEIVFNLPESLTSIDLIGQYCLEAWFAGGTDELVPFDFNSRCPNLCSLSLRIPTFTMEEISLNGSNDGDTRKRCSWLDLHLPLFPPSLTRLCLNWPHLDTNIDLIGFPQHLESLDLSVGVLPNFSWIFSLPNLDTLKLRSVIEFKFDTKNPLGEAFESTHSKLRKLHLSAHAFYDQVQVQGIETVNEALTKALKALIPALPSLEVLSAGYQKHWNDSISNAVNLKSLSIGYAQGASYPPSLTKLKLKGPYPIEMPDSEIVQLPPHLTILRARDLILQDSQASLLPRNITWLEADLGEGGMNPLDLPPSLTFLADTYAEEKTNGEPITDFEILAMKLPNLTRLHHADEDFIRAEKSVSIDRSGWTSLPNALKLGDFPTIEKFTRFHFGSRNLAMKESLLTEHPSDWASFWEKVEDGNFYRGDRKTSVESLEWLRRRGLCSRPRTSFQISSFYPCIANGLGSEDVLAFFKWASPYITPSFWKRYSKNIQLDLVWDTKVPVLDYLYSNGYLRGPQLESDESVLQMTEPHLSPGVDHALTTAVAEAQILAVDWLVNHGHLGHLDLEQILRNCGPHAGDQSPAIEILKSKGFTSTSFCREDGRPLDVSTTEFIHLVLDAMPIDLLTFVPWLDWFISLGMTHTLREKGATTYLTDLLVKKGQESEQTSSWLSFAGWIHERQLPITYSKFRQLKAVALQEAQNLPEDHVIYDRAKWNISTPERSRQGAAVSTWKLIHLIRKAEKSAHK